MTTTHTSTSIHVGTDLPTVRTFPGHVPTFATISFADAVFMHVYTAEQAQALAAAFREAAQFFDPADPSDLRTTTEAEADFQAKLAHAVSA